MTNRNLTRHHLVAGRPLCGADITDQVNPNIMAYPAHARCTKCIANLKTRKLLR